MPWLKLASEWALMYATGALFYLWKRLPFDHVIRHFFVLGGSACHYVAVLLYVVPGSAS